MTIFFDNTLMFKSQNLKHKMACQNFKGKFQIHDSQLDD